MDILSLVQLLNGHSESVDISSNTPVVLSLKVGGSLSNTELTKTILDNLVALQDGSDFANGTNAHTHDARYYTQAQIGSIGVGTSGASLVGVDGVPLNYSIVTQDVKAHLVGIDTALAAIGGVTFSDSVFRVYNDGDNTKRIAFNAANISPSTTRTLTMSDFNTDLGALVNANISASAAIAYSKLSLSNSIVNADIATGAAIAYAKLNLAGSIVNADIAVGAAIAYSKLDLVGSIVNADISASAAIAYSKLALSNSIVNADIAAGAAIAYSKLSLTNSIVNADIAAAAAIAYSKLNLSASIVDADIASGAAIALNKLAAVTALRALESDASGFIVASAVTSTELGYVSGVTSAIQTQINSKISSSEKGANNGVATLDGGGKIPSAQLPNSVMDYKGNWDASTNTPTLADGVGSAGDVYKANVAGTTDFGSGGITFAIGDWAVYNGTIWEKSSNSNAVTSVNSQTGAVVLDTDDIAEGSNLYFTDERAQDAIGSALTNTTTISLSYNDGLNQFSADINALSITNALISASAAIAYSKLNLSNSIVNADVAAGAAIVYSKLDLAGSIVNADINASAAIAYSKLNLSASIVNADIATGAAIAYNKLAALTASRALQSDGSGFVSVSAVTSTELGYVSGVTSAIQTQFTGKASTALDNLASVAINVSLLPGTDNSIDAGSAAKRFANLHSVSSLLYGATSGAITLQAAGTTTSYTVKWPSAQGGVDTFLKNDGSGNLSWTTVSGFTGRANGTAETISSSATSKAVTFSSTLGTTNYAVIAIMNNLVDASPQFQPITITAKSATGFTATWNAPTDSANYILEYIAIPNA